MTVVHAGEIDRPMGSGSPPTRAEHEKIPQAGWVELHDDVEMKRAALVDRATMGPTVVGEGSIL